ncbi:MAG: enoyl-CoA hydratase/isomerase family protein [Gammaproteobacteria bacterium]|nr:enoyl-CoA hydratase/isomerase family protein [Gammaproteobacteria bacterium]
MSDEPLLLEVDQRGVARLTLNRPEVHNAFDDDLISRLIAFLKQIEADDTVRALVLQANGRNFSAGADLRWMKRMSEYSQKENRRDALALAELMRRLNDLPKPTVARVQGAAFGGGVGLVACCDMVVASDTAVFGLTEVRLGLIPAVISPYVIAAIGERAARRWFLTAGRFDVREAHRIGLVHEVVGEDQLSGAVEKLLSELYLAGPQALMAAKDLIFAVSRRPLDSELIVDTAERITRIRASGEGKEGLGAFLEKRSPAWIEE